MKRYDKMSRDEQGEYTMTVLNLTDVFDLLSDRGNLTFKDKREYNERLDDCMEIFYPREKINVKFIVDAEKYFDNSNGDEETDVC